MRGLSRRLALQGYFQSLFACIERLLTSFCVKKLVLPAAEEAETIWTKKFGFAKIAPEEVREMKFSIWWQEILTAILTIPFFFPLKILQLREFRRKYHMMIFQGTSVLQKSVPGLTVDSGSERMAE